MTFAKAARKYWLLLEHRPVRNHQILAPAREGLAKRLDDNVNSLADTPGEPCQRYGQLLAILAEDPVKSSEDIQGSGKFVI